MTCPDHPEFAPDSAYHLAQHFEHEHDVPRPDAAEQAAELDAQYYERPDDTE